jgi:hypothetical protein
MWSSALPRSGSRTASAGSGSTRRVATMYGRTSLCERTLPTTQAGPTFSNRNARSVLLPRGYAPECFNDGDAASSKVRDLRGAES